MKSILDIILAILMLFGLLACAPAESQPTMDTEPSSAHPLLVRVMIYHPHQNQIFHDHDYNDPDVVGESEHQSSEIVLIVCGVAIAEFCYV